MSSLVAKHFWEFQQTMIFDTIAYAVQKNLDRMYWSTEIKIRPTGVDRVIKGWRMKDEHLETGQNGKMRNITLLIN